MKCEVLIVMCLAWNIKERSLMTTYEKNPNLLLQKKVKCLESKAGVGLVLGFFFFGCCFGFFCGAFCVCVYATFLVYVASTPKTWDLSCAII